jgi:acyl dehydratase
MLARFAAASGDRNPIHLDTAVARRAGFDDVIVQGMLVMALVTRAIESWFGRGSIVAISVRFNESVPVDSSIECFGEIVDSGHLPIKINVEARTPDGAVKLRGDAAIRPASTARQKPAQKETSHG